MTKEEILEKSKQENKDMDEMQRVQTQKTGYMAGSAGMIFALIFGGVALFRQESVYPFVAIVFAQLATTGFLSYFNIKKNAMYIVQGFGFGLAALIYTFMHFSGM